MKGLSAFLLPCLVLGAASTHAQAQPETGRNYSFESHNYPNRFIRHRYYLGEVTELVSALDRQDATFRIVAGLAGNQHISFESLNYPGHYLRHQDFRLKLHKFADTPLFREDATFAVRQGLADASKVSFESYNYPGHFIRHRDGHLYIEAGNTELFREGATFEPSSPKWSSKWTLMIYLDGDNNLEDAGLEDFLEMAQVGSSADVNIVVQMDRHPRYSSAYGNWDGTRRFLVGKGDQPDVTPIPHLGEQNMGAQNVLQEFVEWGMGNYEAEHYALVIWNHGSGWRANQERLWKIRRKKRLRGETDLPVARVVAQDETDADELYMREVQDALEDAQANLVGHFGTRVRFDIVGFDACLMGMVEVAYAIRNVADYMVGSEYTEPGDGWPYDTILQDLAVTPSMSARNLSRIIVTKYCESYPYSSGITQSAIDVGKVGAVVNCIDDFTSQALPVGIVPRRAEIAWNRRVKLMATADWRTMRRARENSLVYHPWYVPDRLWGVDLWDFADEVYHRVSGSSIKAAARCLQNAIDEMVVHECHSDDMDGSHGTAIYFPANKLAFNNDPEHSGYEQANTFMPVDFVLQHNWDEWLQKFYSVYYLDDVGWELVSGDGYLSRYPNEPPHVVWYNAPGHNTRARIRATSEADPSNSAEATVTVLKGPRGIVKRCVLGMRRRAFGGGFCRRIPCLREGGRFARIR